MTKYSFEFKQKVVQEYLNGEDGYMLLATKYGITNKCILQRWVSAYKKLGSDGLLRSRKQKAYTFEFKLRVIELYLTTEVSYQELALSVGMNNPPLISKWVNDYRIAGPDALREKQKGRRSRVAKTKPNKKLQNEVENHNDEYLKQLEEENLKLRIENAYLKELRRLRLEGTPQNKKRELSTASEENLN